MTSSAADPLATPTRIAFAGDWHMNGRWAAAAIGHAAEQGADVIVHLGDFGYTFDAAYIRSTERALARAGIGLVFVDGNHEDFPALMSFPVRDNGLRELSPHLWHLPRGFRWEWNGIRVLAMGGAHSVDRQWRTPGISWWAQETLTKDDVTRGASGGPVDVLVAHDCPAGVDIPGLTETAHLWPAEELVAADAHRRLVRAVVDAAQPRTIWHGHYHRRYSTVADLGYGAVSVEGLDCDATSLEDNVVVVNVNSLAANVDV